MNAHDFGPALSAKENPKLYDEMRCLKVCIYCGTEFERHRNAMRICGPCDEQRMAARTRAYLAVRKEIREGRLPHPKTLYCVDCGAFATLYEHRDLNDPLRVDPCCARCNQKRGPAHWAPIARAHDPQLSAVSAPASVGDHQTIPTNPVGIGREVAP